MDTNTELLAEIREMRHLLAKYLAQANPGRTVGINEAMAITGKSQRVLTRLLAAGLLTDCRSEAGVGRRRVFLAEEIEMYKRGGDAALREHKQRSAK